MKIHTALQELSSWAEFRGNLRKYEQIELTERGKLRRLKMITHRLKAVLQKTRMSIMKIYRSGSKAVVPFEGLPMMTEYNE
jgi:hypothetical protein